MILFIEWIRYLKWWLSVWDASIYFFSEFGHKWFILLFGSFGKDDHVWVLQHMCQWDVDIVFIMLLCEFLITRFEYFVNWGEILYHELLNEYFTSLLHRPWIVHHWNRYNEFTIYNIVLNCIRSISFLFKYGYCIL